MVASSKSECRSKLAKRSADLLRPLAHQCHPEERWHRCNSQRRLHGLPSTVHTALQAHLSSCGRSLICQVKLFPVTRNIHLRHRLRKVNHLSTSCQQSHKFQSLRRRRLRLLALLAAPHARGYAKVFRTLRSTEILQTSILLRSS